MTNRLRWFPLLLLSLAPLSPAGRAATAPTSPPIAAASCAPERENLLSFGKIAPPPGNVHLQGNRPDGQIEFGVRSDEMVTGALLRLNYRASPALLPVQSHLQVYLNDELVGIVALDPTPAGSARQAQLTLDPRAIGDFNRLRLSLVGHYADRHENADNNAIWLNIAQDSSLALTLRKLPLQNDLARFPEPFFDARDGQPLTLPMVFAAAPGATEQRAAAIMASWFGVRADWRGQRFPVLYNQLPAQRHALVFATNARRPDFLKTLPPVDKPTLMLRSQPDDACAKMLLVLGRDDNDLVTAAQGIAQGDVLLRGQTAVVESVTPLAPRAPYDAPNWVRTDRPTRFAELQQYEGQFQADGARPRSISLLLRLPPDLYQPRERSIGIHLRYRYSAPLPHDGSRLAVYLNNQFVQDTPLGDKDAPGPWQLHIPLVQGQQDAGTTFALPALRPDIANPLRFDFDYAAAALSREQDGLYADIAPIAHHVVVDGDSSIDFTGYRHYLEMPSLSAFANAGFPFSRQADLAQTLVLVNPTPTPAQVGVLLNTLGNIGAQIGAPALNVQLTDDWRQARDKDVDLLLIGALPAALRDNSNLNLLMSETESLVKKPRRQPRLATAALSADDRQPASLTAIRAEGPLAAIVSFQSPYRDQRAVVALLADSVPASELLNEALNDSGKRAAIYGSVALIRTAGVNSLRVGDSWYVGYLPWWESLWNLLAPHPGWLAAGALAMALLLALIIRRLMRQISRRRLGDEAAS
ncbi:cellulose biosynthesis cyclic di-GMP-binding regulatory protein BcsB [Affinibrenneria salicis]|uniref:Cyclic di-GMP-binding protein n=1 Tax=Affinibrenneria salicis TaxID=2590031 RepID=A0A5J5G1R8_9GAMM|nr:cellulose biosynthesis cyclic di-GMP-binding regulatory protein BcsB [Affinibrenneria salicis]KAA9000696.1 cellulose biosynthesis cyclic di-GMP-binding regulatory protein BcsB [Affinibrenneria salicis]